MTATHTGIKIPVTDKFEVALGKHTPWLVAIAPQAPHTVSHIMTLAPQVTDMVSSVRWRLEKPRDVGLIANRLAWAFSGDFFTTWQGIVVEYTRSSVARRTAASLLDAPNFSEMSTQLARHLAPHTPLTPDANAHGRKPLEMIVALGGDRAWAGLSGMALMTLCQNMVAGIVIPALARKSLELGQSPPPSLKNGLVYSGRELVLGTEEEITNMGYLPAPSSRICPVIIAVRNLLSELLTEQEIPVEPSPGDIVQ